MFRRVLIANRGEIACRVLRTLRALGVETVAVYSEADAHAPHVAMADVAVCVGPPPVKESYLAVERIVAAGVDHGAQAVHPGYGLLSENADFADACEAAGLRFIGPTPDQIRRFGLKHEARAIAAAHGVPLLPGSELVRDVAHAQAEAARVGFPVMLKSTAGGGGIGMQLCRNADELATAFPVVERLSRSNFKEAGLFVERFVAAARHVEVQIFGDGRGRVVSLGERDCSVQRRNQKVIEETPAPRLPDAVRRQLSEAAVRLGEAVQYRSAGTVEFVYDAERTEAYFLEVNTRLQVEHGVTEAVTGTDLVEWMVRLAAGEPVPPPAWNLSARGHAIQVRVYAEDPAKEFQPCAGTLTDAVFPPDTRCDGWVARGTEVSPYYDPLLAKLIVHGTDRDDALARMDTALGATRLAGIETNLEYLRQIVADDVFRAGTQTTRYLSTFAYAPSTIDVLEPGTHTTIQDHPGRIGYWAVGVPPSGPMDARALQLANRAVGNPAGSAALECTVLGPTLRFNRDTVICLAGATMRATLDDRAVPYWEPVTVAAGSTLRLGALDGGGLRTYLAVRGGFDVPEYLGSRSTFTLGRFGGHGGRCLRTGDVLHVTATPSPDTLTAPHPVPTALRPAYPHAWSIGVLYGPHGAPDFFTPDDITMLLSTAWEVHFNSSRTGVRLVGPKPQWARTDGGEAGLHPSNIHDNAYAIGTIDFTGDLPIILGPDGPSLGGFVCPATIVQAELWKVGQLRPGDTVRFVVLSMDDALARAKQYDRALATWDATAVDDDVIPPARVRLPDALHSVAAPADRVAVVYRPSGDEYLLVEYGPLTLDLNLRFRVHALMTALEAAALPGIIDLTPGIRSLQIHYDPRRLSYGALMERLRDAERQLPAIDDLEVPTRIVRLPLSWDDEATQLAIRKYMQVVRADAPWCPSNIEFIRRINGLDSIDDVRAIVFGASYLVLGLGDVYLGAPVATPIDPRHRLVTTKYNPARTWTPENAVGIGGAYLCVYGMEGPGGYQFVGRTCQMWNRYHETADFRPGTPWLLRFFDQIQFYPVAADELLAFRDAFIHGTVQLDIRTDVFRLRDYNAFLAANADGIAGFKAQQQAAFEAERERWKSSLPLASDEPPIVSDDAVTAPPGGAVVCAHVPGNVWKVCVAPGTRVAADDVLVVLESMKMEIAIAAGRAGIVHEIVCVEGRAVAAGDPVCVLAESGNG